MSFVAKSLLGLVLYYVVGHHDIAEDFYDDLARNLIQGHGYVLAPGDPPNHWRAPLYPFFLAAIYGLAGFNHTVVVTAQIVVDSLTSCLLYLIARHVFDRPSALIAGLLVSVYPLTAYYSLRLLSETVFTFLLAAALLVLLRALSSKAWRDLFLGGALLGLATLTRPSVQYLWVPIALLWSRKSWHWRHVSRFGVLLLGLAFTLAPWAVRNYAVTGHFLLVTTGGGYNLWLGNHLATDGRDTDELSGDRAAAVEHAIAGIAGTNGAQFTIENDRRFFRAALAAMVANPRETAWLMARKIWRLGFSIFHPSHRWIEAFILPFQALLLLLASLGTYFALRDRRPCALLLVTVLYFVLMHALTVATFRYSVPILPYLILLGVYGYRRLRLGPVEPDRLAGVARDAALLRAWLPHPRIWR